MVKLVSVLGTTPGGIYETFINLSQGKYEAENPTPVKVDEVYVIRTNNEAVTFAWKLVKAIFACCGSKGIIIADIPLPMDDINSADDFKKFRKEVGSRINVGDYVDFTGGRKAMSVAAALEGLHKRAHIVTTVVSPDEYTRVNNLLKPLKAKERDVEEAGQGKCDQLKEVCDLISKNSRTILFF
jgi:CRISPR-associated protein Csx14